MDNVANVISELVSRRSTGFAVSPPADAGSSVVPGEVREAAKAFEAVFLSEMLAHTGLGEPLKAFGGGAGEAAFSSFMTEQWANRMVDAGGVGVAAVIERALLAKASLDV